MSEHPSARQVEEYCRRQLQPGDFVEVHRHLLSCRLCAETYGVARPRANDYAALQTALLPDADEAAFHLTEAKAAGYAVGEAAGADAEVAEAHLEVCTECARLVTSLRRAGGERTQDAQSIAAGPKSNYPATTFVGLLRGFAQHRLAVAASVVIVVGIATWLILRQGGDRVGREAQVSLPNLNAPGSALPNSNADRARQRQDPAPPAEEEHKEDGRKEDGRDSVSEPRPRTAGRRESPSPRQSPSVALNDGGRVVALTRKGDLIGLPAVPPDVRKAVAAALLSARVETPRDLSDLKGGRSVLLGGGDAAASFRPLSPVGVVTADTRPLLRWNPLPGATSYNVTLTDADYDEVVASGPLSGPEWRVTVPLVRGRVYAWQVAALKDGEEVIAPALPSPAAKFKVLDSEREREMRRAERRYAGSHLILGLLYARAGLLEEASREFRSLSESNPDSAVPAKLLRSVR